MTYNLNLRIQNFELEGLFVDVIKTWECSDKRLALNLEKRLIKANADISYRPTYLTAGFTECFSLDLLNRDIQ